MKPTLHLRPHQILFQIPLLKFDPTLNILSLSLGSKVQLSPATFMMGEPVESQDQQPSTTSNSKMEMKRQLEELQSEEQRRVLDTVSDIRKCGLDTVLSLPQIVVCGDQSSGKSSVLEALTEIPFPRADNLCTRFATEICLRRDAVSNLTIKVIPDSSRSIDEQEEIKKYSETITDFEDLPGVMENAKKVMGISDAGSAFAKDTLSIEIAGPDRPHLTLVDIPGLIQSSTKGVSETDVAMVSEITGRYIEQPRTICLAVISATNDAANQPILERVRKVDPQGERTLGVITKPDRLDPGSGSEAKFLELARNEDVFFKLGWHVVKNRAFKEQEFSMAQRNASEEQFFTTSNFRQLPMGNVGIDALRVRLSHLLLEHVKKELPRLRTDLENTLASAQNELKVLGVSRSTLVECRAFLAELNMGCYELCKAGLGGHYDQDYFQFRFGETVEDNEKLPTKRLRAIVQDSNNRFSEDLRKNGHKYQLLMNKDAELMEGEEEAYKDTDGNQSDAAPNALPKSKALSWARNVLRRCRGTELIGNFNPNLIAELFWEQSERWEKAAKRHIDAVCKTCDQFLWELLSTRAPLDIRSKVWAVIVQSELKTRRAAAHEELGKLLRDRRGFPINYNHYYTDTITAKRRGRMQKQVLRDLPDADYHHTTVKLHQVKAALGSWSTSSTVDMEEVSCEEALDCLLAIYKVQQKTFVANVVTQVIERHIVRDLQNIFSPMVVLKMPDTKLESLVSEPPATRRQRALLKDRIKKLEDGEDIFRSVMGF